MKPATATTTSWAMYRAIVGIGVLCALLIVTVFRTTQARIHSNREEALREAIAVVLPSAASTLAVHIGAGGRLQRSGADDELPAFLGFDGDGGLVGAAITAQGMGYQDNIRVLYAYSFADTAIVGLKVLESKETPGLGDRVETDPHFTSNFERLDAALNASRDALRNPIVTVKQGEKRAAWEIDGLTGATITSVAVGKILNRSMNDWAPALERDKDQPALRDTGTER